MNQQKHFINAGPHGPMCEIGQCGGMRAGQGYIYIPHFGPRTREYVVILEKQFATVQTLDEFYALHDNYGLAGEDELWLTVDPHATIHWDDAWCEELDCLWSEVPVTKFGDTSIIYTKVRGRLEQFPDEKLWVIGMPNYAWVVSAEVAKKDFLMRIPDDLLYQARFWRMINWVSAGGYDFHTESTLRWWAHSEGDRLFSELKSGLYTITERPQATKYLSELLQKRAYDDLQWYKKLF